MIAAAALISALPAPVVLIARNERILAVNPAARRLLGAAVEGRHYITALRQPLLLITDNWVVARAPLEGFEHRVNDLDTLGLDKPESRCRF